MRSLNRHVGSTGRWTATLAVLLVSVSCADTTGPVVLAPPPSPAEQIPLKAVYSMSPASLTSETEEISTAVYGPRWCTFTGRWFDPQEEACRGAKEQPPYGTVSADEETILLAADGTRAAPFLWSAPPLRANPFPDSGDFTVDVRVRVEQAAGYGTGVYLLDWDPASAEGTSSPFRPPVMQIWVDQQGLRVSIPGKQVGIGGVRDEHAYRLVYEDGAYTLFVDGEKLAGPVSSALRPSAVWMGNPVFTYWAPGDWSDFRVSQLTVSTPTPEMMPVAVDVKPGSCPSPMNGKAKGMLPVAIAGSQDLDVSQIDPATLRLEGIAPARSSMEDVTAPVEPFTGRTVDDCAYTGPDGVMDLAAKFPSDDVFAAALADAAVGETRILTLTGNLFPEFGGMPIIGEDVVVRKR
jgi:hypothetical protein